MIKVKIKVKKLFFLGLFIFLFALPLSMSAVNNSISHNIVTSEPSTTMICESGSGVILNTFPVDLDLLFWEDNHTMRNHLLNLIGNNTYPWFITPWGAHFISVHIEGAKKWYLNSWERPLAVRAPHDGTFYALQNWDFGIVYVNDTELVKDIALDIRIGKGCFVELDHLCMLKSIYDYIQANDSYSFKEGELIGYTSPSDPTGYDAFQTDFWYFYNKEPVCPLPYLNASLQTKVKTLYDMQYQRAKLGGTFPESNICSNLLVHIENSAWGAWYYEDGPYNANITDHEVAHRYQMGQVTFLASEFWNNETFHKDPRNMSADLPDDIIGVVTDMYTGTALPGYNAFGFSLVKRVSGNASEGIFEIICAVGGSEWDFNQSVYTRYSIDVGGAGEEDDLLKIEYFENLTDAQSGFTSMSLTYSRYYPIDFFVQGIPSFQFIGVILALFGTAYLFFMLKKRELI